ncbi:glycosyl transferase, group 1 family [gamma proteobacterium NOR5-3]|nr:glycosyl transferase, group 1 family [gamma proteobacterium NOR5-3]
MESKTTRPRLNIAIITGSFPSATQSYIVADVCWLSKTGVNVTVVSSDLGDSAGKQYLSSVSSNAIKQISQAFYEHSVFNLRFSFFTRKLNRTFDPRVGIREAFRRRSFFSKLLPQLASTAPQLIHAHFLEWATVIGLPLSNALQVPLYVTVHEPPERILKMDGAALVALDSKAMGVIFVGRGQMEAYQNLVGQSDRHYLIPNALRAEDYSQTRTSNGGGYSQINILLISRLVKDKRVCDIISALDSLPDYLEHRVTLKIIGDGPERRNLERMASRTTAFRKICFLGAQPNDKVREELSEASLLVHCSENESFGIVIVEAMMSGTPVIAAGSSGVREISEDGRFATIYKPGDVRALRSSICEYADNPTHFTKMATLAKGHVLKTYEAQSRYTRLATLLEI